VVKPFLENITQQILDKRNTDRLTIVLPSKRSIVFLKHYLSKYISKPIWLPKIYSIEDFITDLSGLQTIDNLSLQFRLYEIFDANRPENNVDNFEQFLKWSQTVLYDFNEMDRYLVDPKTLLTNLRHIKELEQWSLNSAELTPFQEKYVQFFNYLYDWYTMLKAHLLKDNLAYHGLAYRQAADSIVNLKHDFDEVWFVGLNALTTAENRIIDHFVTHKNAKLFWDADAHYVENDKHEAGLFLRQHFQQWGNAKLSRFFENDKTIDIIGCAKNVGQARTAGHLLANLAKEDLTDSKTALVLADEKLLFPVLNNLPNSIQSVNITMGAPISSTPLFSLVDLLFRTQLKKNQYGKNKFHSKDIQKLLRNPYLNRLIESSKLIEINRNLNKKNIVFVSTSYLKEVFDDDSQWDILSFILGDWSDTTLAICYIKLFLDKLKNQLVDQEASVESEILFSFYKSIQTLENHLLDFKGDMDLKTLRAIFFQIIGKESIAFMGEPLSGLQMMGVLETRTLDFNNIIIMSVNEGKLPAGKTVNSFIPFILKKHFKMPTHEERDAIFGYHFYRLLQRAKHISIIYNTQNDDFGSGEKSRFITQIINELDHLQINEKFLQSDINSINSMDTISIKKTYDVKNQIIEWSSKKVSSTSLTNFINCRLQFYFKYIAKIYSQNEIVEFIQANSFGTIIHEALKEAYSPHLHKPLRIQLLKEIRKTALTAISAGFQKEVGERINYGKNHLLFQVAKRLTSNFFEAEKIFLSGLTKALVVTDVEVPLKYSLTVEGIKFNLFGNIDRIDKLGNLVRIVDYKSGKVDQKDLSFDTFDELIYDPNKSKAFQLLFYSYLYAKNRKTDQFFKAGIYSLKNLDDGVIYLKYKKTALEINLSVINDFENILKTLLLNILNVEQEFFASKSTNTNNWKDFQSIFQ